jgi:lysophospholipase L1-like esterase
MQIPLSHTLPPGTNNYLSSTAILTSAPNLMLTNTVPLSVGLITAIGDSVMLGAQRALKQMFVNVDVDAVVSRQAGAALNVLRARRDAHRLGDIVVIQIGNNGFFTPKQFDQMMEVLGGVRLVVFVNLKVPRRWEAANNLMLEEGVKRYPNAVLVDWHGASSGQPQLFGRDGIHLGAKGSRLYAELIAERLKVLMVQ